MANLDETNANHAMVMSETCFDSGIFRSTVLLDGSDWTDELHDTVPENIKTRWNEVIRFINEASDEEFYNNIDNYIDIQSVIDYDVFCVVLCGIDSFGKNQMFLTYDGQKWYMSVYDLDSMLGLQWNGSELLPANYPRGAFTDLNRNLLINRVEKLFGKEIAARYREVSQRELSVEHICSSFEEFMADCPQELVEADRVFTSVSGEKIEAPLADTNTLAFIQQFVAERKAYNDQYFEKLARGELFSQGKTDRFGTRIFSLIEPYWSDGYELVDTPWAPYHDDSDWTLALKFKDDIVPDGKYSAIMTAHQGSSPLKLHLKCLTTDGKTTYQLIMGAARDSRFRKISFSAGLVENHQKMDIIISFLQSMVISMTSFTMVRFCKTMVLLLGMFAVMQHCNCLRRMSGKTCYWKKPLVRLKCFASMIAR